MLTGISLKRTAKPSICPEHETQCSGVVIDLCKVVFLKALLVGSVPLHNQGNSCAYRVASTCLTATICRTLHKTTPLLFQELLFVKICGLLAAKNKAAIESRPNIKMLEFRKRAGTGATIIHICEQLPTVFHKI